MSIVVQCPGCPTRLSAPESAAGRQLKCPKCGSLATVSRERAVESPPSKPKPKVTADPVDDDDGDDRPRSRKRRDDDDDDDDRPRKKKRRDDDDDDDDDYDDRPRRKRRNANGGGGRMAVMIAVGLVALIGIGVAIFMLVGKGSRAPLPPGWKVVENAGAGVRGAFPTDPRVVDMGKLFGGFGGLNVPGVGELPQVESVHALTCDGPGGVSTSAHVTRFRGALPRAMRDAAGAGPGRFGGEIKSVRWLGGSGIELRAGNEVVRQVYLDKVIVQASIIGARPEEVDAYFSNFELTK